MARSGEGPWRIEASLLPWEPNFCGIVVEALDSMADGAARSYRPRSRNRNEEADLAVILLMGALMIALGAAELILFALFWPLWWLGRRAFRRPLDLSLTDPAGQWVMVPSDLVAHSIQGRRAELAERIRDGSLRPATARSAGEGLSCAGVGQPLVRRTKALRRSAPTTPTSPGVVGRD